MYHQDYYQKNPIRYRFYRFSCGRDGRLDDVGLESFELDIACERDSGCGRSEKGRE